MHCHRNTNSIQCECKLDSKIAEITRLENFPVYMYAECFSIMYYILCKITKPVVMGKTTRKSTIGSPIWFDSYMYTFAAELFWFLQSLFEWWKKTVRFLGSNLQYYLHATVSLTVKYSAELNKYVMLVGFFLRKIPVSWYFFFFFFSNSRLPWHNLLFSRNEPYPFRQR